MAAFVRGVCLGDARLADAVTRVAIGRERMRAVAREAHIPYSTLRDTLTRLRAAIETAARDHPAEVHLPEVHRETPCKC